MPEATRFPTILSTPNPQEKAEALTKTIGKTIASVEFGRTRQASSELEIEAVILHFADGSSAAVMPGTQTLDSAKAGSIEADMEVIWKDEEDWEAFDEVMGM